MVLSVVAAPPARAADAGFGSCQEISLPVRMAPLQPREAVIAGTLCTPSVWAAGPRTVDVLVHGGMYNRQYWDWPVNPGLYSYVNRTLQAGRATFSYDRYGAGQSSRPLSARATFGADAFGLHQIIEWLRATYRRVDTIGHSLGSAVVVQEAGQYRDSDRVVVTGLTHGHGLGYLTLPTAVRPAANDPQFSGIIPVLDPGYLTTRPDRRKALFYSDSADPAVIAYDEAHKDVMSDTQTSGAVASLSLLPGLNTSNSITAPVLLIVGQLDAPFCNVDVSCASSLTLLLAESPYYTGAQSLTAQVIPGTGHNLPLHPSAPASFQAIDAWLLAH